MKRALAIKKIFTQKNGKHSLSASLPSIMFVISFVFTSFSCKSPTAPGSKGISLSVEDVSCTEAWLNITANNIALPANILIKKNGNNFLNLILINNDTTLYDSTLSPSQIYTYQAEYSKGFAFERSETVTTRTLDTTSSIFTWQTFTFGEPSAGSSALNDAAIISADNIIAVGEIYMNDSTGKPDPLPYNAVHWDGSNWELKRITTEFRGSLVTVPLEGIFAFSPTDIWAIGSLPIHGDGQNWTMYDVRTTTDPSLSLSKAWGSNSNNMYFVGMNGSIAHYQNGQWSKIESGTDWNIYDIFGYTNPTNSQQELLCASTNANDYSSSAILKITNQTKIEKIDLPSNRLTGSVWTTKGFPVYVCGDGVFTNKTGRWEEIKLPVNYVTSKIRGNSLNDIFLCGVLGLIAHYNGKDWKIYNNVYNAVYASVNFEDNTSVFVGWRNGKGVITIGRRN